MKGLFRQHDKLHHRCFTRKRYSACYVFCKSKYMLIINARIIRNIFNQLHTSSDISNISFLHVSKNGKIWSDKLGWWITNAFEGIPSYVSSKHGERCESSKPQCECPYHNVSGLQGHSINDVQSSTTNAFCTIRVTKAVVKLLSKHVCSNINTNVDRK